MLQGCKTARAQWWENNLLEKSVYSKDFSVELGDGKRIAGNKRFCPAEQKKNIVFMGHKEAEGEPRMKFWNSLLRQEKQEKEHLSSYSQSSFRANLSVRYALWFPLTALHSGPKTYLQLIFERVIWVIFLTASFSKCNFEVLPTVSVILTLNLNRDIAPETFDMSWDFPGFDIEQGHDYDKWLSWSNRMYTLRGFSESGAETHWVIHYLWLRCLSDSIYNVAR